MLDYSKDDFLPKKKKSNKVEKTNHIVREDILKKYNQQGLASRKYKPIVQINNKKKNNPFHYGH